MVCFASVIRADDFKTNDGKEYKNVTVSRVEPDGIVLITSIGISKVYFTELPKEVQERFHYDPEKAAAAQAAAQPAAVQQTQEMNRQAAELGKQQKEQQQRQGAQAANQQNIQALVNAYQDLTQRHTRGNIVLVP